MHTIWTIRLLRSCLNFSILFFSAPLIAAIYKEPVLTSALRLFSFQYLFSGLETMSFSLAQRDRKARISNYTDLITGAVMTVFVIGAAAILRSYLALIYGVLLQRALTMVASYFFYRQIGIRLAFDREAIAEQFKFARFILPSSVLTIVLSQYDKLALLKMFNLSLVGIYSIAGNMIAPITGIIVHNSRVILYARCAEYFRTDRSTARSRYYSENSRLLTVGVMLPAAVAGCSQLFVTLLYDKRYAMVGPILMIVALSAMVGAFQNASENVLVASGRTHTYLVANIVRLFTIVPATFLGYFVFGFYGFLWCGFGAMLVVLIYYFYQQHINGLLNLSVEFRRFGAALLVFLI
ncbi:MAG: oligosaccharide flippase family protein, partial [Candidatus Saccharimonadales bacterium]